MPRFSDLFFDGLDARKGWIDAGFGRFGLLLREQKTRVGGLTSDFAEVFEVCWETALEGSEADRAFARCPTHAMKLHEWGTRHPAQ